MQRAIGKALSFWLEDQEKGCPLLQVSYLSFLSPLFHSLAPQLQSNHALAAAGASWAAGACNSEGGDLPLQWEEPWSTRVGKPLSRLLGLTQAQEEHSGEKEINLQLSGLRPGKGNLRGLESPGKITGEGGKAPLKVVCEILSSSQTVQGLILNSVQNLRTGRKRPLSRSQIGHELRH